MDIRFACRNGHLLKAKLRDAGRRMKCPRCRVSVWVPQPATKPPHAARDDGVLTDTQAVRLLGSYHPSQKSLLAAPSPTLTPEDRECPKCREMVPGLMRVCPACNTYVGTTS